MLEKNGELVEQTRVGDEVFEAVVEYAFGTADRYLTMVNRDRRGQYRIARMSFYRTPEGTGWDHSALDAMEATVGDQFQGPPHDA